MLLPLGMSGLQKAGSLKLKGQVPSILTLEKSVTVVGIKEPDLLLPDI